jgi:iron complex outermembrane receptor protein
MSANNRLPALTAAITTGIAVTVFPAVPATAQQADNALVIESITVTARKREEDVQDVPLAITAFSAREIESAGISNLDDVAAFTPGLTFTNLFGEFLAVPVIRGIAPTAIFRENNAAIFVDGVFVSGREGLNASQLDLERIEVLKGPQSTKYGRNAFSGAINFISARPTDEMQGKAEMTVGNDEKRSARVTVSGPLVSNQLAGRLAVGIDEWAGSYGNSLSRVDIGGYQFKTLQTSLWWTPVDALDMQWSVYLSDDEIDDGPRTSLAPNCEDRIDLPDIPDPDNPGQTLPNPEATPRPRPQNFCGEIPDLADDVLGKTEMAVGEERELTRSSLHINWDTDFGMLTALTGYSKTEQTGRADGAQGPTGTVPFGYASTSGPKIFQAEQLVHSTGDKTVEISQELRFSSPQDRAVRAEVGTYLYKVKFTGRNTDVIARLTGDSGQRLPDDFVGFYPAPGVVGDAIFGEWFEQTEVNDQAVGRDETNSWSVFTGAEWDIADKLIADAGVRFTNEEKKIRGISLNPDTPDTVAKDDWGYWTWRAGIKFLPSDDLMLYISAATGKKSGGFDTIQVDLIPPAGEVIEDVVRIFTFDVEKNLTYEIGSKGSFWADRARYDVALFYTDWTDILLPQVFETDPETGFPFDQPTGVDQNGGDATVIGIEASLRFLLSDNLSVSLGGSWTDAEFDRGNLATYRRFPSFWQDTNGDGFGDQGDISGNEVLRQSPVQGNLTFDHRRALQQDWEWYARTDVLYQDAQWVGAANQAELPAHTYVNLRFGFESERYQVEFWSENLLDDDTPIAAFRDVFFTNSSTGVPPPTFLNFEELFPFRLTVRHPNRRTIGLTGRVRF